MADGHIRDGAGPDAHEQVDVAQMHSPIYREHDEPKDGYEPVPVVWILMALALALWSGWYLATFSADFSALLYDGSPVNSTVATPTVPKPMDPLALGRRTFNSCMPCHQGDGKGLPGQFPPLAGSEWVMGEPRILARILLHGLAGPVEVTGKTYNGVMPAWERFDDAQIAAVLTFIRSAWGNNASAVDADLVATERRATKSQNGSWTAAELKAFKP